MTIGNDALPGIITDIESIPTVTVSGISNANVAIVGSGDVVEGEAEVNEPYTITRPTAAPSLFGRDSELNAQVQNAFREGAMPVYAVMADNDPVDEEFEVDYPGALESLQGEDAQELDVIGVVEDANDAVKDKLEETVNQLEEFGDLVVGIAGLGDDLDTSTYTSEFDNSRMGVCYPSRDNDGESVIGALLGMIGNLGLNGSVMNRRMSSHSRLAHRLTQGEQQELVAENVMPIASETQGAKVIDDITAVADDNLEESEMDTVFNRLVIDHITNEVRLVEEPFIGQLNTPATRNALEAMVRSQVRFLKDQNAILDYDIEVVERDANSAFVDVSIETIQPLRNIYNSIAAGRIN